MKVKRIVKGLIIGLAISFFMAGNVVAADFDFEKVSNVKAGMNMAEVTEILGEKKQVVNNKDAVQWIYSETEERFGPDIEKSATIVFNEAGTVEKVFKDEGGLGVWALTSLVLLGLIFI